MAIEKRYLKIKEAAAYLGIHEKSLYRACYRRVIPFSKAPGIGVRFDKRRLDELLESRSLGPGKIKKEGA